jgi:hypothetical protein
MLLKKLLVFISCLLASFLLYASMKALSISEHNIIGILMGLLSYQLTKEITR